ncbi:MAG: zinc ribbon domain-containing protein [Thermoplasmata archaeon]
MTSKLCSMCESMKHDLRLLDGLYNCDVCGLTIDRYHNASKNIKEMGMMKIELVQPLYKSTETAILGLCGIYQYRRMIVYE